jgi:Mg2+/Co2+ transporter CorB
VTLRRLREDPHRLLVTILVGNNLVNVAISSIVTVLLVEHVSAGVAVTAATLVVGCVVLVFGEIVPKSFGLGNARRWSLTVARPVSLVERSISPLVGLFDALTRRLTAWLGGETDIEKPYVE